MRDVPTSTVEMLALSGVTISSALVVLGVRTWLHHRRRLRFRAAAVRAGLDPGEGPWVEAKIGSTILEARELYHTSSRSNPIKETRMSAALPGEFPEAFHASTDENATGLIRATFPTKSGRHEVYVRGLDEADVSRFVDDTFERALAEGLDLCPEAEILPSCVRLSRNRWFSEEDLTRMFRGLSRIARSLAPSLVGYRDS